MDGGQHQQCGAQLSSPSTASLLPPPHLFPLTSKNPKLITSSYTMTMFKLPNYLPIPFFTLLLVSLSNTTVTATASTSIIFTTLGRPRYAFDLFFLPTRRPPTLSSESRISDGNSVNFNGHFPSPSPALLSLLPLNRSFIQHPSPSSQHDDDPINLIYVTERGGSSAIYYDAVSLNPSPTASSSSSSPLHRVQIPLLEGETGIISMKDRPSLSGDLLIYVSTHEDPGKPRTSWSAVYSTHLTTGFTRRLTPSGVADFSPSVSPSGLLTAVASYGETGWTGEVEELSTDIYVFFTRDPTHRVKVVQHGGWPAWIDDSTLYFHRRSSEDGWISVYRAILPSQGSILTESSVVVERVTPPGLHAFTPATSPGNHKFIAVATRRRSSGYRHIELFDLVKNEFTELTRLVSPHAHHLNPFLSPDSERVGYHRCRGGSKDEDEDSTLFFLENVKSPVPKMSLFRFDGSFPAFSPSGDRIVYVNLPGVYVVNRDGSNRRQVYPGMAFSTAWNPAQDGIVYTSTGPTFASESTEVDIISIQVDDCEEMCSVKKMTTNGKNNAFPSVSPDGKWVVFRSSRSGHKNLYVMDGLEGEKGGLYRLTEGAWTDTMCNWSPNGEWIAFSSDRENPGSGSFELFMIHPNGTGLRKLVQSGLGGRVNHPSFSPDGDSLVFTTDYGGISAEPMSNPHHYQPYGEIYTIRLDGSNLKRLTHNSYEDGTPAWSPAYIDPVNVVAPNYAGQCSFDDCHWLNEMPKPKRYGNCGCARAI